MGIQGRHHRGGIRAIVSNSYSTSSFPRVARWRWWRRGQFSSGNRGHSHSEVIYRKAGMQTQIAGRRIYRGQVGQFHTVLVVFESKRKGLDLGSIERHWNGVHPRAMRTLYSVIVYAGARIAIAFGDLHVAGRSHRVYSRAFMLAQVQSHRVLSRIVNALARSTISPAQSSVSCFKIPVKLTGSRPSVRVSSSSSGTKSKRAED